MTKTEKISLVEELAENIRKAPSFYIVNMGGMSVADTFKFRSLCHKSNLTLRMAKNKLIIKALEKVDPEKFKGIYPALKQASSILFVNQDFKEPAKILKELREKKQEFPGLKGAFVEETAFIGEASLDVLVNLKSKMDLLGEIVGIIQSPMSNLISALQSGGSTIAGLVQALEERHTNTTGNE